MKSLQELLGRCNGFDWCWWTSSAQGCFVYATDAVRLELDRNEEDVESRRYQHYVIWWNLDPVLTQCERRETNINYKSWWPERDEKTKSKLIEMWEQYSRNKIMMTILRHWMLIFRKRQWQLPLFGLDDSFGTFHPCHCSSINSFNSKSKHSLVSLERSSATEVHRCRLDLSRIIIDHTGYHHRLAVSNYTKQV